MKHIIFVTGGFLLASTAYAPLVFAQEATSTVDTSQLVFAHSVYIFFIVMFGMVWLMRKH